MRTPGRRRRSQRGPARPIVTLITDFGVSDSYVAAMKAVLIRLCPDVRLVDVTHHIPRHDILCGAIALERAVDGFPPGTIHLAVVDPGVGSDRRLMVADVNAQQVVCPDNGLVTWAFHRLGPVVAHELTWRPERASHTFHGRDILAPAAAMLALGEPPESLTRPMPDPVLLPIAPAVPPLSAGQIIHVDHFGNATTNIPADLLEDDPNRTFAARGRNLGPRRRTYWDAAPGEALVLAGSSGLLEIAVRDGSAAEVLGIRVGDEVRIE